MFKAEGASFGQITAQRAFALCMLLGMQSLTRRRVLVALSSLGIGTAAFQRALAWQAEQSNKVTPELIQQAEWVAGITLSDDDRKAVAQSVERDQRPRVALGAQAALEQPGAARESRPVDPRCRRSHLVGPQAI